ncbi:DUF397 domain-containing protein [Streptomyces sp. NPDC101116]|uniref:DUF397 domain-containing protein n=1 Tax=Streptomyces sp. NPDC101116 TaxID=3366107 RepID=UPI0037F4E20F
MTTVEPAWFKSSYSSSGDGDCVEVAVAPRLDTVLIRDSKNKQGPQLRLSPTAWSVFLTHAGE